MSKINSKDLAEAGKIKKTWQEYTEELYKKDLNGLDNHDDVVTHPEPDILECEVKWALGIITVSKASVGDGIPVELFQILKDDAVKVLHSIYQQIWKLSSGHSTGKGQFSFQSQKRQCQRMFKLPYSCSHCTWSFKVGFNNTWTKNFQMFKLDLEKAEEPEIKLPTSTGS